MNLEQRISAFSDLGIILKKLTKEDLDTLSSHARNQNTWFTKESIKSAIDGISKFLNKDTILQWIDEYTLPVSQKKVGVVMAGNIPLVGFHDLLCVLISGHQLTAKPSSQDSYLIKFVCDELIKINSEFKNRIDLVDKLDNIEAIIATGSNNTARYFEYYFSKYPNIIRKNRTSIGILNGNESSDQLSNLGQDIFQYFGLGCRNVSKLYVPEGYNFSTFFESIEKYNYTKDHHKYNNNYDYNKSIYLVNGDKHLDNGFMLLKESDNLVSPISVLFYEEYSSQKELKSKITAEEKMIQCIVSAQRWWPDSFEFGEAQNPSVDDYADRVDTMKFLCEL